MNHASRTDQVQPANVFTNTNPKVVKDVTKFHSNTTYTSHNQIPYLKHSRHNILNNSVTANVVSANFESTADV